MRSLGSHDCGYVEGNKVKSVLKYMKTHMGPDDFNKLDNWTEATNATLLQLCIDVQTKCMADLLKREEKATSRAKPYVIGFAHRLQALGWGVNGAGCEWKF